MIEGLRLDRVRQAVLVAALRKFGEPLRVTRMDVFDTARHDIQVTEDACGFTAELVPAPTN
jgi:hypothetical protein